MDQYPLTSATDSMAQLEVIVNKLNRRRWPVTDFADKGNIMDVVPSGFKFESVGYIENILGGWHQHKDGLWSWDPRTKKGEDFQATTLYKSIEGIHVQNYLDQRFNGTSISSLIDYNFLLNIPEEIKKTKGNGAVIGLLDVPISTKIPFQKILRPGNILTETSSTEHSNFISGIIGTNSPSTTSGLCSMSTMLDLCFKNREGKLIKEESYYDALADCIRSFSDRKVIVNVSALKSGQLQFALDKFKMLQNVVFVCSAGIDSDLKNIDMSPLVNSFNAISVGVATVDFLNLNSSSIDIRLNVILPHLKYVSYNKDGLTFSQIPDDSSSWGTSVVSAVIGMLFSTGKLSLESTKAEIVEQINSLSKHYMDNSTFLNPIKIR